MHIFLILFFAVVALAERPNILVIMTDDLGYSDLGCYGSEIDTPTLDSLAVKGLRFSQFYNTAKCHSSRVSLLSGQYCIAAGDTALSHTVTSAEVLRAGGYFTAMVGKWHLKKEPTDFGFERYFGHLSGACNFFSGDKTFRLNGKPWSVPKSDFYTTVAKVDYGLRFLKEARSSQKPWYLYVAFNAPHAPLQALPEDYAKYKGRYRQGWDQIRAARVAKQKRIGLLPETLAPSPRPEHIPAWSKLDETRREWEGNRMSTLAAMIDRVDQEVGRLVADITAAGELDNTLILFVSDNGACPYDRRSNQLNAEPTSATVGWSDSTGWAWARNSPFRYYKQNQFEGGISTPGIVHWPAGLKTKAGSITRTPVHLIDVLPTLAEIAKSPIPKEWPGRELRPVSGVSFAPVFAGKPLPRPPIHFLFSSDRGLRDGDWKAVSFRGEAWELYNIRDDRSELKDLATREPERLQSMVKTWTEMTRDVLHAPAKSYAPATAVRLPHRHSEWTNFAKPLGATKPASKKPIRARKNTSLSIKKGIMNLRFNGDDPGIAIDSISGLPPGPFRLSFRVASKAKSGDIFYTTQPDQILPKGTQVAFDLAGDQEWQTISIDLRTPQPIYKLRLDIGDGPGAAKLTELRLLSASGTVLQAWP
jgi:arylsulfatase